MNKRGMDRTPQTRELAVLERVRAIPVGFVSTYGDVSPGAPRYAGSVLFAVDEPGLAWWRVVRADGSLPRARGSAPAFAPRASPSAASASI
jgi:alkylated DNA nucleotide flippase Atl1